MSSKPSINLTPFVEDIQTDNSSLAHLQKRIKDFITKYGDSCRISLAVAGGGGYFLSVFASTPGASQILLQGNILYDRESYRRYVKCSLSTENFKYASVESSQLGAHAALREALILSAAADPKFGHHPTKNMQFSVGVGCSSALSSTDRERTSRIYVTSQMSDSFKVTLEATLAKVGRSRSEEDIYAAHCIVTCIEYMLQLRERLRPLADDGTDDLVAHEKVSSDKGDKIEIKATLIDYKQYTTTASILKKAANLILEGEQETVLLLPKPISDEGPGFQIVNRTVIPPLSVVFPGSFHPPHTGHVQLVKSALDASSCETAWFELSLKNADKDPLDVDAVVERLAKFLDLRDEMPTHWGILLTNAPLFKQKVELLYPLQVSRNYDKEKEEILPPLYFVIGTDTLVRIVDPKYYNNSKEEMLQALRAMPCKFVVGGRLEQKNVDPSTGPVYVTGKEEVESLPVDLRPKFTLIDGFRVDISSSEIRRQEQASE